MSRTMGDAIAGGFIKLILWLCVVCALFGSLLTWVLPKLWAVVKVWIHTITA